VASNFSEQSQRRRTPQRLFDELAVDHLDLPGISRATMFGSDGLRLDTKFFAFVGRDGQLIIKLPAAQAAALVAAGEANPVRAGRGTMREWIGIPSPADHAHADHWRTLITDACRYSASLAPSPTER